MKKIADYLILIVLFVAAAIMYVYQRITNPKLATIESCNRCGRMKKDWKYCKRCGSHKHTKKSR
jgi:rRNA maturation endonuclease Nob1